MKKEYSDIDLAAIIDHPQDYNEDELQSDSSDDSEGSGYEEVQNQPSVDTDNSSTPSEGGSETHDNQSNVNGDTEE